MSKQGGVWVSGAMMDSSLIKGFKTDIEEVNLHLTADAQTRQDRAEPLPAERYPQVMTRNRDQKIGRLPDFCNAGAFWTLSGAFADVLRQFNLGQTRLYPVQVFQFDRKTPVEGEYFTLAFGETKDTLLPEVSRLRRPSYSSPDALEWKLIIGGYKDGDVVLAPAALDGVDLWMESKLRSAFLLSDALVTALKAAKLTRRLSLRRCTVESEQ